MKKLILAAFLFLFLFNCKIFSAQEGLDISSPKTAAPKKTDSSNASGNKKDAPKKEKSVDKPLSLPSPEAKILEQPESSSKKTFFDDKLSYAKKQLQSKEISEIIKSVSGYWNETKNFILNLPGIRHYKKSVYSRENYKKEMSKFSVEYKPHLQKDGQGVKMLKEGAKEF